ncbi:hypothetical protein ACFSCW_00595 [Sphingomonas tabacisoli]|uniref:Haemolysin activator HlyB C-terminal domain-containing protein n=1 Tax=Sphingomonas tabacisoli TaxID=2249466 RepID=A0ABW4HYT8_9SPHN
MAREAISGQIEAPPKALASPASGVLLVSAEPAPDRPSSPAATPIQPPQPPAPDVMPSNRFSVSTWSIVRGRAGPGLASAGQLGGSQAGLRARYELGSGLGAAVRVSGPLQTRLGKEAAVALDWRPLPRVPITLTVERRVGLDHGGRDAFALGIFGGADSIVLPFRGMLDGYAQAGLVGARRRDPYVDGAVRIERPVIRAGKVRIGAGAGLWGGAQPGVSRLDVGPQLVAHVPIGRGAVRIGGEWRERVAGHARPGSGFALSVGADF